MDLSEWYTLPSYNQIKENPGCYSLVSREQCVNSGRDFRWVLCVFRSPVHDLSPDCTKGFLMTKEGYFTVWSESSSIYDEDVWRCKKIEGMEPVLTLRIKTD